jgi:hypothetical protein
LSQQVGKQALKALQRGLAAEHAAVWVYGLATAFLPGTKDVASGAAAHRALRDAARRWVTAAGDAPRQAAAAYRSPSPVTDAASARRALIAAETDCAAAWRAAVEAGTSTSLRKHALDALTGAAVRATGWRQSSDIVPSADPLPGSR